MAELSDGRQRPPAAEAARKPIDASPTDAVDGDAADTDAADTGAADSHGAAGPPPDWQAIVDAVGVSFSVFDPDDRLVVWNRAFASPGGIGPAQVHAGMPLLQVLEAFAVLGRYGPGDPKVLAERRLAEIRHRRETREPEEAVNADGSAVIRNRHRTKDGNTIVVAHNVDQQKLIEQELARTSAILQTVFDTLDQPICAWDKGHRLLAWNDKYLEMNGLNAGEARRGMHAREVFLIAARRGELGEGVPEDLAERRYRAIWSPDIRRREIIRRTRNRTYDVHRGPLPDGGAVSIFNDVTERERTAAELRQAKAQAESANAVKSDFLANMSHELRTPLNAILGFSEMIMLSRLFDQERYREYATDIHGSARILLDIINDLLDLSRIEAGKADFQPTDLNVHAVTENCLNLIRRMDGAARLTIGNQVAKDFQALLDENFLHQSLLNLLSNAVKATPDGGDITVAATLLGGGHFELSVADTGIGMSAEVLQAAFTPYDGSGNSYVRKEKGTGLGLSIVKRLVEMQRGEVSIESTPGEGTTVRLILPLRVSD